MNIKTIPAPLCVSPVKSPAVFSRWVPADLVSAEQDLADRFLGDDMDAICAAAVAAGDPVFIATAALPLARRKDTVKAWRKKAVAGVVSRSAELRAFLDDSPPEFAASVRSGEVPLLEIDRKASAFLDEKSEERKAALISSKDALRAAIRGALKDCDGAEGDHIFPGFIVILQTGEVGIFRRRHAGMDWARAAGCRFFFAPVDKSAIGIHPGPVPG